MGLQTDWGVSLGWVTSEDLSFLLGTISRQLVIELLGESDEIIFTKHIHGLDLKVRFGFWKDLGAAKAV